MAEETATVEVAPELKELGDKIADLTLKEAIELSDYLKDEHSLEPAAGGGVVIAAAGGGAGAAEVEQSEFDVLVRNAAGIVGGEGDLNAVVDVEPLRVMIHLFGF